MATPTACPGARLGDRSQRSQRPEDFGSYRAPRTPARAGEAKWRGARVKPKKLLFDVFFGRKNLGYVNYYMLLSWFS